MRINSRDDRRGDVRGSIKSWAQVRVVSVGESALRSGAVHSMSMRVARGPVRELDLG